MTCVSHTCVPETCVSQTCVTHMCIYPHVSHICVVYLSIHMSHTHTHMCRLSMYAHVRRRTKDGATYMDMYTGTLHTRTYQLISTQAHGHIKVYRHLHQHISMCTQAHCTVLCTPTCHYGVPAIRRLLKIIGLFCRIWSLL